MIWTGDGHGPARETRLCVWYSQACLGDCYAALWTLDNQINKTIFQLHCHISTFFRGYSRAATFMKVTVTFELEHQLSMTDYMILQTECHLQCHQPRLLVRSSKLQKWDWHPYPYFNDYCFNWFKTFILFEEKSITLFFFLNLYTYLSNSKS